MSTEPLTYLDHLILFLPGSTSTKLPIIPSQIESSFTLTPGGTHADGVTSNTLIILADGCYIELICFVPGADEDKIKKHWWGPDAKTKGWKDWCLTTHSTAEENYERLKKGGSHGEPVAGGRKRADGKEVKWSVTFPTGEQGGQRTRGKVPFFCHDITPRSLRVPISESSTKHSSGALGVHSLTILVDSQAALEETAKVHSEVTGVPFIKKDGETWFQIGRIESVDALASGPRIILKVAQGEQEKERVKEKGFWYGDVVLAAPATDSKELGRRERIDEREGDVDGIWVEYV